MSVVGADPLSASEREELDELRASQPGLWLLSLDEAQLVIRGRLSLVAADGDEVDSYVIELRHPRRNRSRLPEVFECAGRIPRSPDRHIFTDTGACCIEFPVEYFLRPRQRIAEYVNGQVQSYFIAQSHFEQFNVWPHGELRHGIEGVQQFCAAHFGDTPLEVIAGGATLFDRPGAKHRPCACGSGRKFVKCHYEALRSLKRWPQNARTELTRRICGSRRS